jgi:hypothetical protein
MPVDKCLDESRLDICCNMVWGNVASVAAALYLNHLPCKSKVGMIQSEFNRNSRFESRFRNSHPYKIHFIMIWSQGRSFISPSGKHVDISWDAETIHSFFRTIMSIQSIVLGPTSERKQKRRKMFGLDQTRTGESRPWLLSRQLSCSLCDCISRLFALFWRYVKICDQLYFPFWLFLGQILCCILPSKSYNYFQFSRKELASQDCLVWYCLARRLRPVLIRE